MTTAFAITPSRPTPPPSVIAGGTTSSSKSWLSRACIIIPALDAEATLTSVVLDLRNAIPALAKSIIVVDDHSRDRTHDVATSLGCIVVKSSSNTDEHGKGDALRTGFELAYARGMTVALTVDADGQHPAEEARRVLFASTDESALVLGVRDLVRDAAPQANRFSNGISNFFLSRFADRPLADTQCGLRRYPIKETMALGARGRGYDFEAELVLRAIWAGTNVCEEPVRVLYPEDRRTHFKVSRDPWRIIRTVIATVGEHWLRSDLRSEQA